MSESKIIRLPNNWKPREYQMEAFRYLQNGGKRAVLVWPRRHGKDDVALNFLACAAMQRVGTYWYCLPESSQSRRAIWEAVNESTGKRRLDEAFPMEIRESTRGQDMFLRFVNGSTLSLVGSDNYDSLVGTPPVGIVFSEFALANPKSWGYLRPILANNGGWAIFVSTPRGRNHLYSLFEHAKTDPEWFAQHLTVEDTKLMSPERLETELKEYVALYGQEEGYHMFRQEYYCSWEGNTSGSYYGTLLDEATTDGRITNVPYDPSIPVVTAWDLGMGDATGIWFAQYVNQEIRLIDYYETSGEGLSYYAKLLNQKPYSYSDSILPHDVRVRELGTGKSRYEMLQSLGVKPLTICPSLPIDDGINAVRTAIPRMWIDKTKCAKGLEHLRGYHKEYDEKAKDYKNRPCHDKDGHAADALRYLVLGYKPQLKVKSVSQMLEGGNQNFGGVW